MNVIVEIPEYIKIGVVLNWDSRTFSSSGKELSREIFQALCKDYMDTPIQLLDGYLSSGNSSLSGAGIGTVGEFLELISCITCDVIAIGFYPEPCCALTPDGIIKKDKFCPRICLENINQ